MSITNKMLNKIDVDIQNLQGSLQPGNLEYWYKKLGSKDKAKMQLAEVGDLVTTPPLEVHALKILEKGNQFIVFSEGLRGGSDYESDTFRVDSIVK